MSEDISSTIRVGVTVILVAALVAAVLNLMVVAQSILGNGMATLQSGVDQISLQEFENYNQTKKSGVEVKSALSLYEGRDIAILVCTKSCQDANGKPTSWWNYGSLLDGTTADSSKATGLVYKMTRDLKQNTGDPHYTEEYWRQNNMIQSCHNIKAITVAGDAEYILPSARFQAQLIKNSTGTIIGIAFKQIT